MLVIMKRKREEKGMEEKGREGEGVCCKVAGGEVLDVREFV